MYGQNLNALYHKRLRQGQRGQLWSALRGRSRRLASLAEVEAQYIVRGRHSAGLRTIPVDQIQGSSGRYDDFDCDFCPLQDHTQYRWLSVARARQEGKSLPPVELVQVGEAYYCLDGHHRISVARAFGQLDIEADVTVWQVREPRTAAAPAARQPMRLAHALAA